MARSGVTYFDIEKAAASLLAGGINPTVDSLRGELGNTGSRTTISKYLKEWRDNKHQLKGGEQLLNESLTEIISSLALKLREQAARPLASAEQAWQETKKGLIAKQEQQKLEHERTTETLKLEESKAEALRTKCQQLEEDNSILNQQLGELRTNVASLTASLEEKDRHLASADEKYQHSQLSLEHFREASALGREQLIAEHQQQSSQLGGQVQQQQQLINHQQEASVQQRAELLSLKKEQQQTEVSMSTLLEHSKQLEIDHGALKHRVNHQHEQIEQLRASSSKQEALHLNEIKQLEVGHHNILQDTQAIVARQSEELKESHQLSTKHQQAELLATAKLETLETVIEQLKPALVKN